MANASPPHIFQTDNLLKLIPSWSKTLTYYKLDECFTPMEKEPWHDNEEILKGYK